MKPARSAPTSCAAAGSLSPMSAILSATALAALLALAAPPAPIDHALIISVDGLRSDMLEPPNIGALPNFARLMRGPHTLEARTDAQYTITLPNHVSMLTGRPVLGPYGHNWTRNDDPAAAKDGGTLHIHKGAYIASVFDVAHDHGLSTCCASTKSKFWLFEQSYGWGAGARDTTGDDNGLAKIDLFAFANSSDEIAGAVVDRLRREDARSLTFVHFAAPDIAGHSFDWIVRPDSRYFASVVEVDRALGELLRAIDGDPELAGRTAIVLTADHGGGVPRKTHTDITCPLNFRIPFLVWSGDAEPSDLYASNPARLKPAREALVGRDDTLQPVRNGDAANAALALLGLPPIPGSFYGSLVPLEPGRR